MPRDLERLISFHETLNPKLWDNSDLRPEVKRKLLKIAQVFIDYINVEDLELEDITISGSNCSYNYNDKSDIDLHLVVSSDSPCWPHLNELYLAKKTLFNDQHDIKIRGIDVEVYVQDSKQPHVSNGIYSLTNEEWIKEPRRITAKVDKTNVEHKYKALKFACQIAIGSGDQERIRKIQDKIKQLRKSGLAQNGEFGPENLAFKMLRNDGTLDELYAAGDEAEDKSLSLPESLNELNISQTLNFIKQAHGDQLYGDLPYWQHPRAVALSGKRIFGSQFNSDAVKVAFLHDVLEDTPVDSSELSRLGFAPEVINAVELLTKDKTLTYMQNIEQIINSGNRLAMMVKYADNHENYSGDKSSWDPNRAASMEKRYRRSMNMLGSKLGVDTVSENFADGKGPGRPGDSQRHGIPKKATMAELEKASHAKGRKGQLARWQLNMRRGKKRAANEADGRYDHIYNQMDSMSAWEALEHMDSLNLTINEDPQMHQYWMNRRQELGKDIAKDWALMGLNTDLVAPTADYLKTLGFQMPDLEIARGIYSSGRKIDDDLIYLLDHGEVVEALNIYNGLITAFDYEPNVRIDLDEIEQEKPTIIKNMLARIKSGRNLDRLISNIRQLKQMGITWPELDVMVASLGHGQQLKEIDMSRRSFLGGIASAVAAANLPKVAGDALSEILKITTPDHLENIQHAFKKRGTLLQFTRTELDRIYDKTGYIDGWKGWADPNIDQAYEKMTGERMIASRVKDILKDAGISPEKFFQSPRVAQVIDKVREEWQAQWKAAQASADPFKDPNYDPNKMTDPEKIKQAELKRDAAFKQLTAPKHKGLADPDEEEELAIGRAGPTESIDSLRKLAGLK